MTEYEEAHLDDFLLAQPALLHALLRVHREGDERPHIRRGIEPDAREVAELAKAELEEQLRRERAVIEEVQPRVVLHEGQTPRRVHNAHKRVFREDLCQFCREGEGTRDVVSKRRSIVRVVCVRVAWGMEDGFNVSSNRY